MCVYFCVCVSVCVCVNAILTVTLAVVLMSHAVVADRTRGCTDPDLPHVLSVQEHEESGFTCDAAIYAGTRRAATRAHGVASDDS